MSSRSDATTTTTTSTSKPRGKVLVTGGAGFIGSHLVEGLLADGWDVRVLDNLSTGYRSNLEHISDHYEVMLGDAGDFETCRAAVETVDYVLHHAAIPSVPRSMRTPLETHHSGSLATLNMLEAARQEGVKRFVFAASSSAYGNTEELPKHERMYPAPMSPYAADKLAGEGMVSVYAQSMGLDGVCFRYFNIFGPRQDPSSPYSGVISRFVDLMLRGEQPTIFGDGQQTRDFTYVANVVRANLLAIRSPKPLGGIVMNVGTGERISLLDLITELNTLLGTNLTPQFEPFRVGDVRDSLAALGRIEQTLGYTPQVFFAEGLKRTLAAVVASKSSSSPSS